MEETRVEPNTFLALVPVAWPIEQAAALIEEVFVETWIEECSVELESLEYDEDDPEAFRGRGQIEVGGMALTLWIEAPIPHLVEQAQASGTFAPEEIELLRRHDQIYRLSLSAQGRPGAAARRFAKVLSALVEAGSPAVVIPAMHRLHSSRFVKLQASQIEDISSLINLFVSAWDNEEWMISRGLTCFELPELYTPIDQGYNAAYFRLMDVAANMVMMGGGFDPSRALQIGSQLYRLRSDDPEDIGPDPRVSFAGHYGRLGLFPG